MLAGARSQRVLSALVEFGFDLGDNKGLCEEEQQLLGHNSGNPCPSEEVGANGLGAPWQDLHPSGGRRH